MQTQSVDHLIGHILGNYRLERLLGCGRLNAVYLALHLETQERVALTLFIIPEKFSRDARKRFMQRFYKEAAVLTALRHPHILPVYEYGEYAGYPYLVTPYMMNGSLADLLKQGEGFSHDQVLEILEQVAEGLGYAHSKGMVHGALKPSNIVLGSQQEMLVAGLGLMHIQRMRGTEQSNQPHAHLLSVAGTFLFAPEYSAPEIVEDRLIDARSDVYALGIILFELLSGKPPFRGTNPLEVAKMHVQQAAPSLRTLVPNVPVVVASVVNQALERDPERRFRNVSELAEAFSQATWGATGALRALQQPGNAGKLPDSPALRQPSTDDLPSNWQLLPPIRTGKMSAIVPPAQSASVKKAPAPDTIMPATPMEAEDNTRVWQLQPPIVTGRLPAVQPSPTTDKRSTVDVSPYGKGVQEKRNPVYERPAFLEDVTPSPAGASVQPMQPVSLVPPVQPVQRLALADQYGEKPVSPADEWWATPPLDPQLIRQAELPSWSSQTSSGKRSRSSGKSASRIGRRRTVALLATGGVVAAGTAVVLNTHLLNMVEKMMQPVSASAGNKTTGVANPPQTKAKAPVNTTSTQQKQTSAQTQNAGHTGTVIGTNKMAVNSSLGFSNPADQNTSLLICLPNGNFVAYERACTHEGVTVNYDPKTHMIVCPAHGAIFDPAKNAAVVQGPATSPLTSVAIRVNGDGTITTV